MPGKLMIRLLGSQGVCRYKRTAHALEIELPAAGPAPIAIALEIMSGDV